MNIVNKEEYTPEQRKKVDYLIDTIKEENKSNIIPSEMLQRITTCITSRLPMDEIWRSIFYTYTAQGNATGYQNQNSIYPGDPSYVSDSNDNGQNAINSTPWLEKLSSSDVYENINIVIGNLVDQSLEVELTPKYAYEGIELDAKVGLFSEFINNEIMSQLGKRQLTGKMLRNAMMYGVAYLSVNWNTGGDVFQQAPETVAKSASLQLAPLDPITVYFDQQAKVFEDASYVFHIQRVNKNWLSHQDRFNKEVVSQIINSDQACLALSMIAQQDFFYRMFHYIHTSGSETFRDTVDYTVFMVKSKDGIEIWELAGLFVLNKFTIKSKYFPICCLVLNPSTIRPYGTGYAEMALPWQTFVNKLLSIIRQSALIQQAPTTLVAKNANATDAIVQSLGIPGSVVEVDVSELDGKLENAIAHIPAPEIPEVLMNVVQYCESKIKSIFGVSNAYAGNMSITGAGSALGNQILQQAKAVQNNLLNAYESMVLSLFEMSTESYLNLVKDANSFYIKVRKFDPNADSTVVWEQLDNTWVKGKEFEANIVSNIKTRDDLDNEWQKALALIQMNQAGDVPYISQEEMIQIANLHTKNYSLARIAAQKSTVNMQLSSILYEAIMTMVEMNAQNQSQYSPQTGIQLLTLALSGNLSIMDAQKILQQVQQQEQQAQQQQAQQQKQAGGANAQQPNSYASQGANQQMFSNNTGNNQYGG